MLGCPARFAEAVLASLLGELSSLLLLVPFCTRATASTAGDCLVRRDSRRTLLCLAFGFLVHWLPWLQYQIGNCKCAVPCLRCTKLQLTLKLSGVPMRIGPHIERCCPSATRPSLHTKSPVVTCKCSCGSCNIACSHEVRLTAISTPIGATHQNLGTSSFVQHRRVVCPSHQEHC